MEEDIRKFSLLLELVGNLRDVQNHCLFLRNAQQDAFRRP
jgi:hypothetical protein